MLKGKASVAAGIFVAAQEAFIPAASPRDGQV